MNKLKELADLLTMNKLKSIEIIDQSISPDSMMMILYNGIRSDEFLDDEHAWKKLYPNAKNKNAYYKLKHTLRERLFNTLFFIDVKSNKFRDIHSARLQLQKLTSLLKILRTKGLKQNAVDIARKGLKIADAFEFTEEKLIFLTALRSYTAVLSADPKEFEYYRNRADQCADLLRAETKIEGCVQEILMLNANDKSTKTFLFQHIQQQLKELKAYEPAESSVNWLYHYSMIQIAGCLTKNDYEKGLATCEKALAKIKKLPFVHAKSIVSISIQAVSCCMQLHQFEKGEKLLLYGLSIMQKGTFNWFKYYELYIMLSFHAEKYEKAYALFSKSIGHSNFSNLPSNALEVWKIYEAWFYFLAKASLIPQVKKIKQFKTARYLNELPIYSKDKSGLNIAIIVSRLAILLIDRKLDVLIDGTEAINRYKDRYIDKAHNLRSNLFINMLLKIPSCNFQKKMILKKVEKDSHRLKSLPLSKAKQSSDIEIFPYEKLWDILIKKMN